MQECVRVCLYVKVLVCVCVCVHHVYLCVTLLLSVYVHVLQCEYGFRTWFVIFEIEHIHLLTLEETTLEMEFLMQATKTLHTKPDKS